VKTPTRWPGIVLAALLAVAAVPALVQGGSHGDAGRDLPLGFIRSDPAVIRGQIEISLAYLRSALAVLEGSDALTPEALLAASDIAHQGYRAMRFAVEGLGGLTNKPYANPLYGMVYTAINEARFSIIHARLALGAAAKWTDNNRSQIDDAIAKLRYAVSLAEQAHHLI
jgi:hypothetical protein